MIRDNVQKLVDIAYSLGLAAADGMSGRSVSDIDRWVSHQLRDCGFPNQRIGGTAVLLGKVVDRAEQDVVDVAFETTRAAALAGLSRQRDDIAALVTEGLARRGYVTEPVGMSWGSLVSWPDGPMDYESFAATILRYVHDDVSGEFANVGLLMYAPLRKRLSLTVVDSTMRLRAFFSTLNEPVLVRRLEAFSAATMALASRLPEADGHGDVQSLAGLIVPHDDVHFRWSPTIEGRTDNPSAKELRLYARYVTKHDAWNRTDAQAASNSLELVSAGRPE